MNQSQEEWTNKRCEALDCILATMFSGGTVPTEQEWELIADIIEVIAKKVNHNTEVTDRLFDVVRKWEAKQRNAKKM